MTNTLTSPQLDTVLGRLFAAADRSDAYDGYYIPVSAHAGKLLYTLARAIRPRTVVEFGTSYGISTMYLAAAAAVTDNGTGQLVTTELSAKKAAAARAALDEAGVGAVVTILEGDALETLAGVAGPVELVLLDGWKDLCLPVLKFLEPLLAPGALVAADDITFDSMAGYLDYVRDPANGYVTVTFPVEDGIELSSWTGAVSR
jgi:predicted O-methyltransferase YrrM